MTNNLRIKLADFLQKMGQTERAIGLLERARVASTKDKDVLLALGRTYYRLGRFHESLVIYQETEALYPDDTSLKWEIGTAFLSTGHYEAALTYFQLFETGGVPNDQVHALLGTTLLNLERWVEAEGYLRSALEIAPWNADACKGMIDLLRRSGRFDEIRPFLEEYIEKAPDQYPGYAFLAMHIHEDLYDPAGSLEWYERGLGRTDYRHAKEYRKFYMVCQNLYDSLLRNYVLALVECNKSDQALTLIRAERRKRPGDFGPISHLIDYHLALESYTVAERLARKSMKKHKTSAGWLLLALSLSRQGRNDEALVQARRATEMDPLLLYAWLVLADTQIARDEWQDAISDIRRFLTFMPYDPDGLKSLAFCYKQMNQLEQAVEVYGKLVKISPLNAEAWAGLGDVYHKLGRSGEAIAALERALSFGRLSEEHEREAQALLAEAKGRSGK